MQNSNPITARSGLFFLAACLLPTVVQSERIALAPGIDRLLATAGIGAQVDFVASNRNLQEATEDPLAGLFGDDDLFATLLGNEDLLQCSEATNAMYESFPELNQATLDFGESVVAIPEVVGDSLIMNMEYSEESKETLRQACADSGGHFVVSEAPLSCTFFDEEGEGSLVTDIAGFANCYANTEACKAIDILEFLSMAMSLAGAECDSIPTKGKPPTLPMNPEEATEDPLAGLFGDDDLFATLLGNEDLLQCSEATNAMYESFPELNQATLDFGESVVAIPEVVGDSLIMNMEYSEESKETLRQACADSGGHFVVSEAPLSCTFFDEEGEGSLVTDIAGFANCYANTEACKAIDILEFLSMAMSLAGAECDSIPTNEDSSAATTSSGAGHHWSFDYLILSGMVVGASFF